MKTKAFITLAGAVLLASACSNDEYTPGSANAPVAACIIAGVNGPDTRAVDNKWNADRIGVMVTDAPASDMENMYKNVSYSTPAINETSADFSPTTAGEGIFFQDADETVSFAAYAPYQSSLPGMLPGDDGVITADTRVQSSISQQEAFDFLYASGATASKSLPIVAFTKLDDNRDYAFRHCMSRLTLKLQTSTADGFDDADVSRISKISLGALVHSGTFDVTTGVAQADAIPATDDWDIIDNFNEMLVNDEITQRIYTLILFPQDIVDEFGAARAMPLVVTIDGQNYENNETIAPRSLEAGKSYEYTITVKRTGLVVSGCTITDWVTGHTSSGDAILN